MNPQAERLERKQGYQPEDEENNRDYPEHTASYATTQLTKSLYTKAWTTVLAEPPEISRGTGARRASKADGHGCGRLREHITGIDVSCAEIALREALSRKRIAERAKGKPTELV